MRQVSLRRLRSDPLRVFAGEADRQGPVAEMRFGRQRIFYVSTPEAVEDMFIRHADSLVKWGRARRWWIWRPKAFEKGRFLFNREKRKHLAARRQVRPAFAVPHVAADVPAHAELTQNVMSQIVRRTGGQVDLWQLAGALVVSGTAFSLMGVKLDAEPASEYAAATAPTTRILYAFYSWGSTLLQIVLHPISLLRQIGHYRKVYKIVKRFPDHGLLGAALADMPPIQRVLHSTLLLQAATTPEVLTKMFIYVSQPEVVRELRGEIDSLPKTEPLTAETLDQLVKCQRAVKEVLRLGSGWHISRMVERPFSALGVDFRVGDFVTCSPILMHADPRYWDRPTVFDLSRWERPIARYTFFPFGFGASTCLGQPLAETQLVLTLIAVLRDWDVYVDPELQDAPWEMGLRGDTILPSVPMVASFQARSVTGREQRVQVGALRA